MPALKDILYQLYGDENQRMLSDLETTLAQEHYNPHLAPDWYQQARLYVTYPDAFKDQKQANLQTLIEKIPHIQNLACNAIHLLPIFESPMEALT